jgi:hypothetical protein
MILGVLVVVPTFAGVWELGRTPSLHPLEIAKAFNAELLQGPGSNASVKRLAKDYKTQRVKYGEAIDEKCGSTGRVWSLVDSTQAEGPRMRGRRLELADPSWIVQPRGKAVYF